jgi:putative copper export protein
VALPADTRPTAHRRASHDVAFPTGCEQRVHPPTPRALVPVVLVSAGLLLAAVFVAALLVGGGGPPPPLAGLPDAGALTGWGRPVVDLAGRVLAVLTVGQLTYAALLAPAAPTGPGSGALRALRGSTWSAAGWLAAEVLTLVLTASALYGVPVSDLSPQAVLALPSQLPVGRATVWVVVLLTVLIAGSARLARGTLRARRAQARTAAVALLLVSLTAVTVPGVLAGHSAAADDHIPAVIALSVHVITASLWVGGLAGLLLYGRGRSQTVHAVRRFSALALACVVLLLASGVFAAVLVAGPPAASWASQGWALLLAVKTALLGLLAAIGWWHRRRTLPALAAGTPGAFLRLGVLEVALMALTLTLSVALAASPAPTPSTGTTGTPSGAPAPAVPDDTDPQGTAPGDNGTAVDPPAPVKADVPAPTTPTIAQDMSGHDHGDLSVSILVDEDRFHVAGTVRPGQPVTVYNSSDAAVTITALDGSFEADVGPRTFITFTAPTEPGDFGFTSRPEGRAVHGFVDTLLVRADP